MSKIMKIVLLEANNLGEDMVFTPFFPLGEVKNSLILQEASPNKPQFTLRLLPFTPFTASKDIFNP